MKCSLKLTILTAIFAAASIYAAWPEAGDFTSSTFNLDTATPQTTITLQNNAALSYNLNWGSTKAASASIFADGLSGAETAGIANYAVMASSTSDGYGNTYQWDYAATTKSELPKGSYTLSHVTYDSSTPQPVVLETIKCQVKLLPEPALAIVLGILGLAFAGRKSVKVLVPVLIAEAAITASAANIVSSVKAYPRWPWNGKVDIVYAIDDEASQKFDVAFQVKNGDTILPMNNVEGTEAKPSSTMAMDSVIGAGEHVLTWDAGLDFPSQAVEGLKCLVAAKECHQYMRVDLESGAVTNLTLAAAKTDWTDDDKSKYLWLKKVYACTFKMGADTVSNNPQHDVTLTNDFWIGVFQLTRDQYNKIGGPKGTYSRPNGNGIYPANYISYYDLRGTNTTAQFDWPRDGHEVASSSAMGKLREKVNSAMKSDYPFDLPTDAQWECACRAGHEGNYWNNGDAENIDLTAKTDPNLDKLAWYKNTATDSQTHEVGGKDPSSWGFYDMHGNVYEWCLDWKADLTAAAATDPAGPTSGTYRLGRGGSCGNSAALCRSAFRNSGNPSGRNSGIGARVVLEFN